MTERMLRNKMKRTKEISDLPSEIFEDKSSSSSPSPPKSKSSPLSTTELTEKPKRGRKHLRKYDEIEEILSGAPGKIRKLNEEDAASPLTMDFSTLRKRNIGRNRKDTFVYIYINDKKIRGEPSTKVALLYKIMQGLQNKTLRSLNGIDVGNYGTPLFSSNKVPPYILVNFDANTAQKLLSKTKADSSDDDFLVSEFMPMK